jgi:hypothetical protein
VGLADGALAVVGSKLAVGVVLHAATIAADVMATGSSVPSCGALSEDAG